MLPSGIIGGALPTLSYEDSGSDSGTAASTRTVSGLDFGTPAPRRFLVATVTLVTPAAITAVTIGGVSATIVAQATANVTRVGIAIALVPTGSSGNVAVTAGATYATLAVGLYALTGLQSATPYDTATASSPLSDSSSLNLSLDVPANGLVVAVEQNGQVGGGSAGNESWSGLSENFGGTTGGAYRSSWASGTSTVLQAPRSVSVSNLTGNAGRSGAAASFR